MSCRCLYEGSSSMVCSLEVGVVVSSFNYESSNQRDVFSHLMQEIYK